MTDQQTTTAEMDIRSALRGTSVDLRAMLDAREARAAGQAKLRGAYPDAALISFTLNIPGPVKTNPALRRLFDAGLDEIRSVLASLDLPIVACEIVHEATGDEALLAVRGDAERIKTHMTAIEERIDINRLYDIDVLTPAGEKLGRDIPRRCLLCERPAHDCARSRRHSVGELTRYIARMLDA